MEHTTRVKERQGDAHHSLQPLLDRPEPGASLIPHLIEHLILSKGEHWYQMSAKRKGVSHLFS